MSKKGFTLIELIAALIIVMVILLIVVPNVRSILKRNTLKLWQESENRLVDASRKYILLNNIEIDENASITITKEQLMEEKLIKEIYDLNNKNNICDAYVVVNNVAGEYQEKAHIECENGYVTE